MQPKKEGPVNSPYFDYSRDGRVLFYLKKNKAVLLLSSIHVNGQNAVKHYISISIFYNNIVTGFASYIRYLDHSPPLKSKYLQQKFFKYLAKVIYPQVKLAVPPGC